ncbi:MULTISPECIES: uroporphyrinogen decarboxylase family protein [Aerococcus]|uniref:uroporphyrinogen decarboxylase family protein n=1 Tax=Aerococcus TaxID=1375 RepID=UPI0018A79CB8|nr:MULTISPECIES: uroporphyrinogen decarboxylase family protein [Aerococcus]MCY3035748.1 uroporphyrinogen decarboxylase [Aerococcus sp. Group 2]MCY3039882.1 uroporphyrinogen decarboxylase [Aerococcus sp. Group 2]MCY3040416.1 uroporphyrinogen decarboxylase [Aerococcus sp. Group 2]MCY3043340.1 uroporphyrinogen decarboxylase [Aerococcus sp. Group 2]MDK6519860.1 uroporphyrinogen decarboxylase family protein [Aerococcus urinae]
MSKKDLLKSVLNKEKTHRTPVGFWHHFLADEHHSDALENKNYKIENLKGHEQFIKEVQPDYIKIMTDGYFLYPNEDLRTAESLADVPSIQSLGKDHPWIREQVQFAKEVEDLHHDELYSFYNIFGPLTTWKFLYDERDERLGRFFQENPEYFAEILRVIAEDIRSVIEGVLSETTVDGIYYSTQDLQTDVFTDQDFKNLVKPLDISLLETAEQIKDHHILHICGFSGAHNQLEKFLDYPATAVNWATQSEHLPISEGKKLFKDRVIVGGFPNTANDLIYQGSEQEIKDYTKELIKEAADLSYILGADCTIPKDTPTEHLEWVRQASREVGVDNEE